MPINLNLELTDHCNIKCKMCSQSMRDEAHGVPMKFMAWETWQKSLHNLQTFTDEIHLCPHWLGEPTLHPQFNRFVEYAFALNTGNRLFREFKVHTNAVIFDESRAKLLLNLANMKSMAPDTFNFIHFSIDAFSRDVYTEVKGADRREQVYRNVLRFIKMRTKMGFIRPFITLAFVVQPDNAHEALTFHNYWKGILNEQQIYPRVTYDWPDRHIDTIYLRRLNCGDQQKADLLHEEIVRELEIPLDRPLRSAESF